MKIFNALLFAAVAVILKTLLDDRRAGSVAAPRRVPADRHAGSTSVEDEVTGPLAEI